MIATEQHNKAMELVDRAVLAGREGKTDVERELFRKAFELERKAAMAFVGEYGTEPTRSVLFRSASAIALDAGLSRKSERMAAFGLSGNPPDSIAVELREMYERASFARHLSVKDIELLPNEFQVSLWSGTQAGYGIVSKNELTLRLDKTEGLIGRTLARKHGIEFQENSSVAREHRGKVQTFVSTPRAQSFAFTVRVGASPQLDLFSGSSSRDIVEELISCLDLFNQGQEDKLRDRIHDETYYRNFVYQARSLAPDGEKIKGVGLTASIEGKNRQISFKPRSQLQPKPPEPDKHDEDEVGEKVKIVGLLSAASSLKGRYVKILPDQETKSQKIKVPKGMLRDIVAPYFHENVVVEARKTNSGLELVEIEPVASE